jgi:hypothetical protein
MSDKADQIVNDLNEGDYESASRRLYDEAQFNAGGFQQLKNELKDQTKDWMREIYEEDGCLYMDTSYIYDRKLFDPSTAAGGKGLVGTAIRDGSHPIVDVGKPLGGVAQMVEDLKNQ